MNDPRSILKNDQKTDQLHNPFPGLRPFTIKESHLFFGREGQSDEILMRLSQNRFISIIGPSGSGKSSFVYCGILPTLYGGFLSGMSSDWEVIVTKPGGGPINNLSEALLKFSEDYKSLTEEERKVKKTILTTLMRSNSLGLVEAIKQFDKPKNINYLILVDQFEELFWYRQHQQADSLNETFAFTNLLLEAVNHEDIPIYVAITMRSDFIGECAQYPRLTHKINSSHYLIPQMTRKQKRKAIEGPLAVGGVQASPRLLQRLLNDLGDNPDQLPIMQHALMRTWEHWLKHREDATEKVIDIKNYEAIGSMVEALSLHANEAYNELNEKQKRICELTFRSITEKRGKKVGVRRPTKLKDIIAIVEAPEKEVIEVINKFRESGRSLVTPAHGISLNANSMIDISHESLMRIWDRLKEWVDNESESSQMYLRLAEAARMHQAGKGNLWRPPDLQLALNWFERTLPTSVWGKRYNPAFERTMAFLEYSRKEYETEQRIKAIEQKRKLTRAKVTAIIFGSLMVVTLLFFVYAIYQQTEAQKQANLARNNEQEANKQRDKAQKSTESAKEQQRKAEEAGKAATTEKLRAERNLTRARHLQSIADEQRKLAQENATKARINEHLAEENAKLAGKERTLAIQNAEEAKRARYIAQAKAMALKSQELFNNRELQALLAQQGFNFNQANGGYAYDKDIYDSFFHALSSYKHPITKSFESHKLGAVRALTSTPTGNYIYSGGTDGSIVRWSHKEGSWKTENIIFSNTGHHPIFSISIDPTGRYLATGGVYNLDRNQNYMEIYDLNNLEVAPKKIIGYTSNIRDIHFSPDSTSIYSWGNSGYSIYRYQLDDNQNTATEIISSTVKIHAIALSNDGNLLAGSGDDGNLYLWELDNEYATTKIRISNEPLAAVTFDPTDNRILVGNILGLIYIIENGDIIRELSGHSSSIESLIFNHAGTFVASASKDATVRLWNYSNLRAQPITMRNQDWTWSAIFSADDKELIVGINSTRETLEDTDYSVRIWPADLSGLSNILCSLIGRNMTQDEWDIFVGEDLPYEFTCQNLSEKD